MLYSLKQALSIPQTHNSPSTKFINTNLQTHGFFGHEKKAKQRSLRRCHMGCLAEHTKKSEGGKIITQHNIFRNLRCALIVSWEQVIKTCKKSETTFLACEGVIEKKRRWQNHQAAWFCRTHEKKQRRQNHQEAWFGRTHIKKRRWQNHQAAWFGRSQEKKSKVAKSSSSITYRRSLFAAKKLTRQIVQKKKRSQRWRWSEVKWSVQRTKIVF